MTRDDFYWSDEYTDSVYNKWGRDTQYHIRQVQSALTRLLQEFQSANTSFHFPFHGFEFMLLIQEVETLQGELGNLYWSIQRLNKQSLQKLWDLHRQLVYALSPLTVETTNVTSQLKREPATRRRSSRRPELTIDQVKLFRHRVVMHRQVANMVHILMEQCIASSGSYYDPNQTLDKAISNAWQNCWAKRYTNLGLNVSVKEMENFWRCASNFFSIVWKVWFLKGSVHDTSSDL